MKDTHKYTETWYILAIRDAFLDQKRVNVYEHAVITAPHECVCVCMYVYLKSKNLQLKWFCYTSQARP